MRLLDVVCVCHVNVLKARLSLMANNRQIWLWSSLFKRASNYKEAILVIGVSVLGYLRTSRLLICKG